MGDTDFLEVDSTDDNLSLSIESYYSDVYRLMQSQSPYMYLKVDDYGRLVFENP